MADAGVPCAESAWGASNLFQSVSEAAAVQPLPANLGKFVDDLHTVLVYPSKVEVLQSNDERSDPTRPGEIVVPTSMKLRSPSAVSSPNSPANQASSSTLSVLSAAAASLKDKTQQVAQQQKRALSAFQQKGGLVGWLHGEMDEPGDRSSSNSNSVSWSAASVPTSPAALQTSHDLFTFVGNDDRDDLRTPPSPRSPIDSPIAPAIAGRRRSMPNMTSGSLLDNLFYKVTGVTASPVVQPSSNNASAQMRVKLRPTVSPNKIPATSFDDFVNGKQAGNLSPRSRASSPPETVRQRATTMDLTQNSAIGADGLPSPVLTKVRSAASLNSSRLSPETRLSLDDVLSDEWSSTVLWAYIYSSADGRDHQHHQRMSFLIETTFRVTPLYRKLAGGNDTAADSEHDFKRLLAGLKRIHSRFLVRHGAATLAMSGVPVASPAASHAKNQLAVAVHTLSDQRAPANALATDAQMEKAVALLLQLAREVECEFRVLGTRSYTNFADSALYRDFIVHGSGRGNIAMLLRAARIPFYQQPNSVVDPLSLNDLALEQELAAATVFSRAKCQVFAVALSPDGSIKFTGVSQLARAESTLEQTNLQQTIEPFLNPAASIHPAASRPLAFNFSAGSGDKVFYGAVLWLPVDQNKTGEIPSGLCIVSKFPLVDSMRYFLSFLWKRSEDSIKLCGGGGVSVTQEDVQDASLSMGQYFLARNQGSQFQLTLPDNALPPAVDFRISDLFDCLSLTNVLRLFAFVLLEKKVVMVASSYTVMFSVSEALRILLYPLVWSHVFVPVLPLALKDCLQCPTPFIFGLHDSYVRRSDMPRPSNDLVIVNLDRDSLTGGGDVFLPPVRHSMLREELFRLCKPHLAYRDSVDSFDAGTSSSEVFPVSNIRLLFRKHLREILASLEPCVNRFELNGQGVSVVDNANVNQWPADTARFCSAMLHTQAVSTFLASPRSEGSAKAELIFV
ncbi:hypothetical protein ON010_g720 [Phytophthora cinnamomi]|nr:hypothetical protein ON010_g720 [Phytophthora cinnamomi]